MEKRFRVFLILVLAAACGALVWLGVMTAARLSDTETRLDSEDRAAFAELAGRLAEPGNITGVKVQVASTMGDYRRYENFDKQLLSTLTFVSHEYLYGGEGQPDTDIEITVTLYKRPENALRRWLCSLSDRWLGTSYLTAVEDVTMYMEDDMLRVRYGEASFTAASAAVTGWIRTRRAEIQ